MWELTSNLANDPEGIQFLLKVGFEPFAVTIDSRAHRIWFRKKVNEVKIYHEPVQPDSRRSRKTASKS